MNIAEILKNKITENQEAVDLHSLIEQKRKESQEEKDNLLKEKRRAQMIKPRNNYIKKKEKEGMKPATIFFEVELLKAVDEEIQEINKIKPYTRIDFFNDLLREKYNKK